MSVLGGKNIISDSKLKRSKIVFLISLILVLSPIGNFIFSMWASGIWSSTFDLWNVIYIPISLNDKIVSAALFFSGILLFRQHRYSWIFAVIILFSIALLNLANLIGWRAHYEVQWQRLQLAISFAMTLAGVLILTYLRYPFVDRRLSLFVNDQRLELAVDGYVEIGLEKFRVTVISISKSGAKLKLHLSNDFNLGFEIGAKGFLTVESSSSLQFRILKVGGDSIRVRWIKRLSNLNEWKGKSQ